MNANFQLPFFCFFFSLSTLSSTIGPTFPEITKLICWSSLAIKLTLCFSRSTSVELNLPKICKHNRASLNMLCRITWSTVHTYLLCHCPSVERIWPILINTSRLKILQQTFDLYNELNLLLENFTYWSTVLYEMRTLLQTRVKTWTKTVDNSQTNTNSNSRTEPRDVCRGTKSKRAKCPE